MQVIKSFIYKYLVGLALPHLTVIDVVEMLIIAVAIYQIIMWVKNTRAWMLVKGIIFLLIFSIICIILQMDVILWIFKNAISVGIIAVIIVFQPELRSALEHLGRKNVFRSMFPSDDDKKNMKFPTSTITALVKACNEMSRVKTGALIVLENEIKLRKAELSGIIVDGVVTSQLLLNIFEHNTPLHDGAVIIRDNRVLAATCYLPVSDNMELSKELGTRHRAAVGISEESDSLTIIVSEETGGISVAKDGILIRDINTEQLSAMISEMNGDAVSSKGIIKQLFHRKERSESNEKEKN